MNPRIPPERLLAGGAVDAAGQRARSLLTRLPQPTPIDRLSQERGWRRLSGSLWRGRPSPWRLVPLAAALALVAVAGALWVRWSGRVDDLISLPRARVLLVDRAQLTVESLAPDTVLQLRGGEVIASVDPRRPGEHFAVQTARYRVTVKGTIFSVRERAEDDVEVSVSRGLVEVTGEGGRWDVGAGQSWRSKRPDAREADDVPASARARLDATPVPEPELPPVARPPVVLPPPPLVIAPARPRPKPQLARLDPPSAKVSPVTPDTPSRGARQGAGSAGGSPLPAPAPFVSLERPPVPPQPSTASIKPNKPPPSHPDLALYELARARQQAGDVAGALEAYGRYGREYPAGALAQEAAVSEIELTLERHDLAGAAAEIDRFLDRHGESERAAEMHLRRGDLRRAQGDALGALRDYGIAARTGAGDVADDAAYLVSVCDEHLARTDDAAAAARDYLRRFPAGRHAAAVGAALGNGR